MRRFVTALSIVLTLGVGALVAGGPATAGEMAGKVSSPRISPLAKPPTVSIPIRMTNAPLSNGANGLVRIRLGGAPPIWVMLDTGSVGLRVFPGGWSGKATSGFVSAPFAIGGVKATGDVKFQVVTTTNPYIAAWRRQGVFGILGIGTGRSPVPNPLASLPRELGKRWSVHFVRTPGQSQRDGSLILGAVVPSNAQATFQLSTQGTAANGARLWADHEAQACWTIGRVQDQCVDTWFDSGFHLTRVKGSAFADVPTKKSGLVRSGVSIEMSAPGSAFTVLRFRSGERLSTNVVEIFSDKGRSSINTGNAPFFDYTVTYDINRGLIALGHRVPTS